MCQCLACSCCTTCLTLSEVLVIGFPAAVQFLDGSGRRADLSPEVDPVIYKYCIGNFWLCHTWANLTIICTLNCWSKLFVNYKISHLVYFVLMIFHLQSVKHFLCPKNQEIRNFFSQKSGGYQEFFSIKSNNFIQNYK